MLYLGVWMSIQNMVEKTHNGQRCQHDALATSCIDAWNTRLNIQAFKNVYKRLRVMLQCVVDNDGGTGKVEEKRGKLFVWMQTL